MAGKKAVGRPQITINWRTVEEYLRAQCTGNEIAGLLGIHKDTLYDRCVEVHGQNFSDYSANFKQKGQAELRAAMFRQSLEGNTSMQIWLSKNYLGMKDRTENENTHVIASPIEVKITRDDTTSDPIE